MKRVITDGIMNAEKGIQLMAETRSEHISMFGEHGISDWDRISENPKFIGTVRHEEQEHVWIQVYGDSMIDNIQYVPEESLLGKMTDSSFNKLMEMKGKWEHAYATMIETLLNHTVWIDVSLGDAMRLALFFDLKKESDIYKLFK